MSDKDLDENEYCSETIADLFGYSDSDEEFHGYVSDGWEIVTSSSLSESPSGSDSDDENVDIAASGMPPTSSPLPSSPPKRKKKTKDKKDNDCPPGFNMKGWKKGDQYFSSKLPDFKETAGINIPIPDDADEIKFLTVVYCRPSY